MTLPALIPGPGYTLMMGFAGLVFGFIYFAALRRTVQLFTEGRTWFGPLALTLGRVGAAVVFLGLVAQFGAVSLLAVFIGFLLARTVALRVARRAA